MIRGDKNGNEIPKKEEDKKRELEEEWRKLKEGEKINPKKRQEIETQFKDRI